MSGRKPAQKSRVAEFRRSLIETRKRGCPVNWGYFAALNFRAGIGAPNLVVALAHASKTIDSMGRFFAKDHGLDLNGRGAALRSSLNFRLGWDRFPWIESHSNGAAAMRSD